MCFDVHTPSLSSRKFPSFFSSLFGWYVQSAAVTLTKIVWTRCHEGMLLLLLLSELYVVRPPYKQIL